MLPQLEFAPDPLVQGLDVYIVGGAVRDALLKQPSGDRDWVVVGSTPEDMAARGFIPVGGDFPVFLHPHTKEEYALARTERKSGRGYKGFTFYAGQDVTLEQDLTRRDLTINALAYGHKRGRKSGREGQLLDPLNGRADLHAKILRHVGAAFTEDPVRLLRLARFAARFDDFSIAPQTLELARMIVKAGEVDALVPERVWQELAKGLMTDHPARMLEVLATTHALPRILPGLDFSAAVSQPLTQSARQQLTLPQRFALLCLGTQTPAQLARHLKAPKVCTELARLLPVALEALRAPANTTPAAATILDLIEQTDGLRRASRLTSLLQAAACVVPVNLPAWQHYLQCVSSVDAGAIATQAAQQAGNAPTATAIKTALRQARLNALAEVLPQ